MNPTLQKFLQPTFLFGLAATIKLILQPFGIEIPDNTLNMIVNVICGVATVFGLWVDHGNKVISRTDTMPTTPVGETVVVQEPSTTQFPNQP